MLTKLAKKKNSKDEKNPKEQEDFLSKIKKKIGASKKQIDKLIEEEKNQKKSDDLKNMLN